MMNQVIVIDWQTPTSQKKLVCLGSNLHDVSIEERSQIMATLLGALARAVENSSEFGWISAPAAMVDWQVFAVELDSGEQAVRLQQMIWDSLNSIELEGGIQAIEIE